MERVDSEIFEGKVIFAVKFAPILLFYCRHGRRSVWPGAHQGKLYHYQPVSKCFKLQS